MKETRKYLYRIQKKRMKNIEKNHLKLEKNLAKLQNYYDCDDIEYRGIGDVKKLSDWSIDEDYYKPIIKSSVLIAIILNMKVKKIKAKLYQLQNIFIWSDHI